MSNKKQATVKPELVGGVRDYLPQTMITRQKMLDKIRSVYENFGFVPLETPAVERLDVLTGDEPQFKMNLFRSVIARGTESTESAAKRQSKGSEMALRFDLTVPLSRIIAAYPDDIPKIFKRYQVGRVWRGEKPQAGRYREFVQFDADIIGSRSMLADTEIIQIMYSVMKALKIENFLIRVNNRKILNGLIEYLGVKKQERADEIMRILDKKEKIGDQEMAQELSREPKNEYDVAAPNLDDQQIKSVIDFVNIEKGTLKTLDQAEEIIGQTKIGQEGIKELKEVIENLKILEISQDSWVIDLSIARGLGYYTGPVFETTLTDLPEMGSVYSGGRFDGLSNRFIPGSNIPGVGTSVGVDRLFAGLEKLDKIKGRPSISQVLVAMFDPKLKEDYLKIVDKIRQAGISAELYLEPDPFKTQLIYAAKQEIPLVVILGPDEKEGGQISIRDMEAHQQTTINRKNLVKKIKEILKNKR